MTLKLYNFIPIYICSIVLSLSSLLTFRCKKDHYAHTTSALVRRERGVLALGAR